MSSDDETLTVGAASSAQPEPPLAPKEQPGADGTFPTKVLKVLVLAGGLSHERDVSLRSGRRVMEALRAAGVEVSWHDVDAELLPFLAATKPDVVWPLLHGASGEDGSVRAVLDLVGAKYVGTGPRASRAAWDKTIAKGIAVNANVDTPEHVTLPQSLFRELGARPVLDAIGARLGFPLAVKPTQGGSALGVSIVDKPEQLPKAMVSCFAYGEVALIERAVKGVELAVSIVDCGDGPQALPPVEIVAEGHYDYDARYNPGRAEYFTPARIDAAAAERVKEVALNLHRALGLRHLSRSDIILEADGTVQFLEVNVAPGMTETSLLPQAAAAAGLALPDLYRSIAEFAARD